MGCAISIATYPSARAFSEDNKCANGIDTSFDSFVHNIAVTRFCGFVTAVAAWSKVMYEDPPRRMFIDMWPPHDPEKGDVWIRLGEWRIFEDGDWFPRWEPPEDKAMALYPKPWRRKKVKVDGSPSA